MKYIVLSWNRGHLNQVVLCTNEAGEVLLFDTQLSADDWAWDNLNGEWLTVCIFNP